MGVASDAIKKLDPFFPNANGLPFLAAYIISGFDFLIKTIPNAP